MYKFVRLAELYYAGSHGMDIKGPAKGSKYKKVSLLSEYHSKHLLIAFISFLFLMVIFGTLHFRVVKVFFANQQVSFFQ